MRKCLAFTMILIVLLCAIPVAISGFRAALSHQPPLLTVKEKQVLTVWLVGDTRAYLPWLKKYTSGYEKSGISVYMRMAASEELTAENAVLPDVVLFTPFTLEGPEGLFIPVEAPQAVRQSALLCGRYRLEQYAVPVALRGYVLACDKKLCGQSNNAPETSWPGLRSPTPTQAPTFSPFPFDKLTKVSCTAGAPLALLYAFDKGLTASLSSSLPNGTTAAMLPNDKASSFYTIAPGTGLTDDFLCCALTDNREISLQYLAMLLSSSAQNELYTLGFVPVTDNAAQTGICLSFQAETILPNVFEARKEIWQGACQAYTTHLGSLENHLRAFR